MSHRPNLVGCQAKIRWAQHHFDTLNKQVREFFSPHPYSISLKADPKNSRYIVCLQNPLKPPLDDWAMIIGDCVHNLRSSLDYIAWELAGGNIADTTTMFPICDTPESFANSERRIKRIPSKGQAVIEKFQSYHGRKKGWDPHHHILWLLNTLDSRDKHKLLTIVAAQTIAGFLQIANAPDCGTRLIPESTFEDKAEVAEIILDTFVPDVKVNAYLMFDIAFEDSKGKKLFASAFIPKIMAEIDRVISAFKHEGFFP